MAECLKQRRGTFYEARFSIFAQKLTQKHITSFIIAVENEFSANTSFIYNDNHERSLIMSFRKHNRHVPLLKIEQKHPDRLSNFSSIYILMPVPVI